jgi:predicted small secreted protein
VNCCKEIHGLSRETDVQYLKLDPDEDEEEDSFQKSFVFIDAALDKGKNVLVHCESGLNQAAAIVTYYVMKKKEINLAESYKLVKEQRKKTIKIRPSLIQKLIKAEKALRGSISVMLDGRKVIYLDAIDKRSSDRKTSYAAYYTAFAVIAFFSALFLGIFLATGKI